MKLLVSSKDSLDVAPLAGSYDDVLECSGPVSEKEIKISDCFERVEKRKAKTHAKSTILALVLNFARSVERISRREVPFGCCLS